MTWAFETLNPIPNDPSPSIRPYPNPSQVALPAGAQTFKYMSPPKLPQGSIDFGKMYLRPTRQKRVDTKGTHGKYDQEPMT